ncbi:hypothetical protein [Chondromyces crocatus]|uniref:Uncharacterized protein n=1 Tax=Chondromyces crocatus TaxID=52 RepID=A0A0K1E5H0_CHOCO|nr:hypothetical protein [Chondromyces crocatus]AKT36115.1 uncharacterized protein CMC5_002280 [Chondromyces crocatus]
MQSEPTSQVPVVRSKPLLLGGAIFVLAGSIFGTVMFMRGAPGGAYTVPVADGMPLALGDKLTMRAGRAACDVSVLGRSPDGRVLGLACGAREPTPLVRSVLHARTSVYFQGGPAKGDLVLVHHSGAWSRAEVLGPEMDRNTRVRVLEGELHEPKVDQKSLVIVQRASEASAEGVSVPLPTGAPIEVGDLLSLREEGQDEGRGEGPGEGSREEQAKARFVSVRVESIAGETVRLQPGRGFPVFIPDAAAASEHPRARLWVHAVRAIDPVAPGAVVLVQDQDDKEVWGRWTVVGPEKGRTLRLRQLASSVEVVRAQDDVLVVRSGG